MSLPSVAGRWSWYALALAPAIAASLWPAPAGDAARLLLALGIALLVEGVGLLLRGLALRRLARDPGALPLAALVWLWLGGGADSLVLVPAVAAAVAIRCAFGGTGQSPFHPAATAVAAAALFGLSSAPAWSGVQAVALLAGGGLLFWRGLLAPATIGGWVLGLACGAWLSGEPLLAGVTWLSADRLLVACFVLSDGGSAGLRSGPRWLTAAAAGVLGPVLPGAAALPCAVLLANLLSPAFEALWPARRRPA